MNITIKRNIVEELACFKIKIKLMSKVIRLGIILFLLGVCAIIICQNDFGVTENSLVCYLILEMALFTFSFLVFKRVYDYRTLYKTFSKSALKEYQNHETYSTIYLDDSYFTYESKRKYYKFSWSSFVKYDFKNENLVLMVNESYSLAFIIKQTELTPEEFHELRSLILKTIPFKKVR
jgi:hypothetical protein